ncbi:MAG: hypothetical protein NDI77_00635 [Geobacteraceae bacterium]|nr:hypothetical protein [Geobacteraceae bacterium]
MKNLILNKGSSFIMAAVVLASMTVGAGPGFAALLAKSPVITPGGYPSWFQDQTGLALQGCLNDPPRVPNLCLLPDGVIEQPGFLPGEPKVFPDNFPIEHFYFIASTAPITLTNGSIATEMEFAVEAAFNPDVIANPNQEMFHRLRLIFSPNIAEGPGTYVVVHPWGATVIPPALQQEPFGIGGVRGRATIDVNIGAATGSLLNDNFAGVLGNDPLFTISNYITQTTPAPPVGFLGDCLTQSPVVGGVNGNIVQILFRPAIGPDVLVGETELFVVCGQKTGLEVSPASAAFGFWKPATPSTATTFTVTNLAGVDIPAAGLILTPDNPAFSIPADTCADGVSALAPGNTCTFDVVFTPTANGLASGAITIASAGNPDATVSVTGSGDGIAPTVILGAGQATQFTNAAAATISGTVTDNAGGAGVASVQISVNNGPIQTLTTSGPTWSFNITNLTLNAENTIAVTATDLAQVGGNVSAPLAATITHDDILPQVSLVSPAAGLTNNTTPTLTFTVTETNPGINIVKVDGATVTPTPATLGPLADGSHTVIVEATDSAANLGTATTTFTVDATPPVIAVTSPAPLDGRLGSTSPALTFTVDDANPVPANTVVRLDTVVVPPGTTTLGPFAAGEFHTLTVDTTDGAGNIATTNTVTFTIVLADGRIVSLGATPPTIADALIALRHAVQLTLLAGDSFSHADVAPLDPVTNIPNPNGTVDLADALVILRRVVGLVTTF